MLRVIILYGPEDSSTTSLTNTVKTAFENEGCETTVQTAKSTVMPDIAASDIIIIGSLFKGKKSVHPDFKEITRALRGINLAGKIAGIITFTGDNTVPYFREILQDSDIAIYEESLYLEENNSSSATAEWAKKIITLYKEGL